MNRIYKTIWNKTKRCLSVVSELAKSHSGGGTVVKTTTKKAFLLMSFAAMLAPQVMPSAYATEYIVSAGTTHSNQYLDFGDSEKVYGTAYSTLVNLSGNVHASSAPVQHVYNGGIARGTYVNGYGSQRIYTSGAAYSTTVSGWTQSSQTGTTHYSAHQYIQGGSAVSTTLLADGIQHISSGGATFTSVNSGAQQHIYGGSATVTMVYGGGEQYIHGGSVSNTTLSGSHESLSNQDQAKQVISAGSAVDTRIFADSVQIISAGASADTTTLQGTSDAILVLQLGLAAQDVYGSAHNTEIYQGGYQQVRGKASQTTIYSGGEQRIVLGGEDTGGGTTVKNGGLQNIVGGKATSTTISADGIQEIHGR